jgi:Spy/CpxP family protein refolding chaperone
MRKTQRLAVVAGTLLIAGAAAGVGVAAPPEGEGRPGARRAGGRSAALVEYLGLSEPQKAARRELHVQRREQMKPLVEEGRDLRARLREAVGKEAPDPAAVGEATLAIEKHRRQMSAEREAFRARLEALLSAEQMEKLRAFEAARRSMGGGREGRRGPRPGRRAPGAPPVEG